MKFLVNFLKCLINLVAVLGAVVGIFYVYICANADNIIPWYMKILIGILALSVGVVVDELCVMIFSRGYIEMKEFDEKLLADLIIEAYEKKEKEKENSVSH